MKFCNQCAAPVELAIPSGDTRERYVCGACATIHYQNPRIIAGCLPIWDQAVLLCRRAIDPRSGFWTLPAGFLENHETCEAGAARETWEEACTEVQVEGLYTVFSLPHISQVYLFFRAQLKDGSFGAGAETREARLFREHDVPWDELAFPVIRRTHEYYFADSPDGHYPVRSEAIQVKRR
jgi:ADP-ribose pyrophosphatase YjhB (NUDIX family)